MVFPCLEMTRKRAQVNESEVHGEPPAGLPTSLFSATEALRVPTVGREEFELWGHRLGALVHRFVARRWPSPLACPEVPRLTLAALGHDLRRLSAFVAEVNAAGSGSAALRRRLEITRQRLIDLAAELEAECDPPDSAASPVEKELVDVGL